jgi:hypothetical protein
MVIDIYDKNEGYSFMIKNVAFKAAGVDKRKLIDVDFTFDCDTKN